MTGRLEEALSSASSSPTEGPHRSSPETVRAMRGAVRPRGMSSDSGGDPMEVSPIGNNPVGSITPSPTKRNKRKMTAPKRRSDFSIKRFCPDLMAEGVRDPNIEDYDDLRREGVPDRAPGGSTGSSPAESLGRDSRPSSSSATTSPTSALGDGDKYHGVTTSTPPPTPEQFSRRIRRGSNTTMASPSLSSAQGEPQNQGVSSPGSPRPIDMRSNNDFNNRQGSQIHQIPMELQHHPAFGLNRHLAMTAHLPAHLPPVPSGTPAALLPGHPHIQQQSMHQGFIPMNHLQVPFPGRASPANTEDFQHTPGPPSPADSTSSRADGSSSSGGRKTRKNYKNMTRERRVEANARERSRVHTISAAFESLRRAVPSYSYNQKLSKLAILRIACSYILSLAKLADLNLSKEHSDYTFADCVDMCTSVIQTEGRARRRH